MNGIKTLTYILFPLFVGFIIGGAASGNTSLLIWGCWLLVLDIIVGITVQHSIDNASENNDWDRLSLEEKRAIAHIWLEKAKQDMRNEGIDVDGDMDRFCDEFNREHRLGKYSTENYDRDNDQSPGKELCERLNDIYLKIKATGGERFVTFKDIRNDEVGVFLLDVCEQMPHAPLLHTLSGLYQAFVDNLNGNPAIVYKFIYNQNSICQNVYIFLVPTKAKKIRFFAVETDFSNFVLCEYSGNRHLNYGKVDLGSIEMKIEKMLNT